MSGDRRGKHFRDFVLTEAKSSPTLDLLRQFRRKYCDHCYFSSESMADMWKHAEDAHGIVQLAQETDK